MSKEQISLYIEQTIIWNIHDLLLDYVNEGEFGACLERKAMVTHLSKIGKVEVYFDHEPKHFHIKSERLDLKFKIDNLEQIHGQPLNSKQKKNLINWYFERGGKERVVRFWNERNPENLF
jgi:hypothetical protein